MISIIAIIRVITITAEHCVTIVRIWSYSGPFFPAFGLNNLCLYFFYLLLIQYLLLLFIDVIGHFYH